MGDRPAEVRDFDIPVAETTEGALVRASPRRITDTPWFYLLLAIIGLGIGRGLSPDPRGFGTHEALGLPGCTFFNLTSVPCPACGMTTAVSHAAHGDFLQSAKTQPAGFLIGVGLWLSIPALLIAWHRNWTVDKLLPPEPAHRLGWGVIILPILGLAWIYKIAVVLILS